jgi:hypothetical protein
MKPSPEAWVGCTNKLGSGLRWCTWKAGRERKGRKDEAPNCRCCCGCCELAKRGGGESDGEGFPAGDLVLRPAFTPSASR